MSVMFAAMIAVTKPQCCNARACRQYWLTAVSSLVSCLLRCSMTLGSRSMVAPAVSFALTFLPEGVSGKRDRHSVRAEQLRHCAVGAAQHGHQGLDALATLSAALCSVEGDLSWAQVAHSLDVERRKPAASFALRDCDLECPSFGTLLAEF